MKFYWSHPALLAATNEFKNKILKKNQHRPEKDRPVINWFQDQPTALQPISDKTCPQLILLSYLIYAPAAPPAPALHPLAPPAHAPTAPSAPDPPFVRTKMFCWVSA